jgi:hypothetical protein
MYRRKHDYASAEPMIQKALKLAGKLYGDDSPELLAYLNVYSALVHDTKDRRIGKDLKARMKSLRASAK